ncbi:hypothetical protein BJP25_02450 [Actinokineospora bangkokensis]|uniref:Histidine kinase/HSP90-like ATPase domain-containing protein n=1 Tax=Actinokineospora bangkokensis TaxID=1193682 RepID=A0A1Q9LE69_9PSEU|nr:hypothetical protein BJP25_02450 [Actinokineospora bangkokensis]
MTARAEDSRSLRLWDAYYAVGYLFVPALIASGDAPGRFWAAGAVLAIGVLYAAYGRDRAVLRERAPHTWVFTAVSLVLFAVALRLAPASAFALFALCPMVFMALPLAAAAPVVVLANLLPLLVPALTGQGVGDLGGLLPTAVLGLALSLLMGTFIHRVVRQNGERARLIGELEASRAEVVRLSHEAGVAAERARLAGEIHDTLAQGFTSIITLLQAAEADQDRDRVDRALALATRTARENLAEARAMVAALAPTALAGGGLVAALRRQVERLAAETGTAADFHAEGVPGGGLPTGVEVVLLRTAQEALANVGKHAGATAVTVDLVHAAGAVVLTVTDDGAGFDPGAPTDGYGLRGMRARAEQVRGELAVQSAPGQGTTVVLKVRP